MALTEIKEIVSHAISKVFACDSELLERDASEWSIAHRLAVYLEQEIPGWHVDCEYNRQENAVKKCRDGDTVRPDIIIHHRGGLELEHNLLVIEIKKKTSESDLGKVIEYTSPPNGERKFQYQFGLALTFKKEGYPDLRWFQGGRGL
jgi:hypothetical protein